MTSYRRQIAHFIWAIHGSIPNKKSVLYVRNLLIYVTLRSASVLACFSVDSRIRYENGSVDANRSMRLRRRIHLKTQWCGQEHLLNKSESQKNDIILPIRRHQDLRTNLLVFWSSLTWCSSSYFIRVFYFACVSFAGIFIRATLASHFFPNVNSHENIHYVQCSNLLYYRNISSM